MTRRRPPPIEDVAAVAERLAVLLGAGVPPQAAWGYLAADGDADAAVARVAAVPDGTELAAAIANAGARADDGQAAAWRALAAAWLVATEAGAPLAATLRTLAESFRALGQAERDIRVALAGPRATARIVIALPFVGILFGLAMGFDTLRVLVASAPGIVCLLLGSLLLAAGARWNRALVARARPRSSAPGLELDLVAVGMSGGVSVDRARALVAEAVRRFRLDGAGPRRRDAGRARSRDPDRAGPRDAGRAGPRDVDGPRPREATVALPPADGASGRRARGGPLAAGASSGTSAVERVLALAVRAGAPAGELLRSEAERCRREERTGAQQDAATLGVLLMLPLGCCILPSFLLLGVAPVLIALVSSTVGSLG